MGTWGEGLWQSDDALDRLQDLLEEADLLWDEEAGRPRDESREVDRDPEVVAILGQVSTYVDAWMREPGAERVLAPCAALLDRIGDHATLYEAARDLGAALGLLVLLDPRIEPSTLARWQAAYAALDARTTSERDFWDEYREAVELAFERLG